MLGATFLSEFWPEFVEEMIKHAPVLISRTALTFVTILFVVRWTGKRAVANLAPFDLAVVILIGEVAAIPVADIRVHLTHGVLPVLIIGALHILLTTINLHSRRFETFIEGKPRVLVKDGQVLKQNLLKERVSLIDLESALRHKDVTDVSQVKEARMEPGGGVSVILKRADDAATLSDLESAVEEIVQAGSARMRQELQELLRQRRTTPGG